jgi:hypothetical protein
MEQDIIWLYENGKFMFFSFFQVWNLDKLILDFEMFEDSVLSESMFSKIASWFLAWNGQIFNI